MRICRVAREVRGGIAAPATLARNFAANPLHKQQTEHATALTAGCGRAGPQGGAMLIEGLTLGQISASLTESSARIIARRYQQWL